MNTFLLFLFVFIRINVNAQQVLIPFRDGNKYGLSDGNGKMIVKPEYDHITWMQDKYFETTNSILLKDTLEYQPYKFHIRNKSVDFKGLMYNGKTILKNEPYDKFEIIPGKCIIAKSDFRYNELTKEQYERFKQKEKFLSIFDINGNNIYPENFKSIQKFDTAGVSTIRKGHARYILFGSMNFERKMSLFVFDSDIKKISEWVIKDADKIKVKDTEYRLKNILFEVTQDGNLTQKLLNYSSGKFIIKDALVKQRSKDISEIIEYGQGSGSGIIGDENIAVPEGMDRETVQIIPEAERRKAFKPYYNYIKDSLHYVTFHNERTYLPLPVNVTPLSYNPSSIQYQPYIFKQGNAFGILKNGKVMTAGYDSLQYFGSDYIAGKFIGNRMKFAIIDSNEKILVPFLYDSIRGNALTLQVDYEIPNNLERIVIKEKNTNRYSREKSIVNPYLQRSSDRIILYKDGKAGMMNLNHEIIIPVENDMLAENETGSSGSRKSDFYILKKGSRYGIAVIKMNRETKKLEPEYTISHLFDAYPIYYINNYYGVKGMKLFAMYNNRYKFLGFANEIGFKFYRDKL